MAFASGPPLSTLGIAATLVAILSFSRSTSAADDPPVPPAAEAVPAADAAAPTASPGWHALPTADPSLWKACQFGGDGDVVIGERAIRLGFGDPLTGVRCTAELPRENFELELEGRRVSGFDFFCGLTFPVGDGQCSLILGGWAGGIAGISSIDGEDASENQTKRLMHFDNERWYRVRVRVDANTVQAWVDDQKIVDQPREGHKFDIRAEMFPSLPLGVAAFQCESELRNFRWRKVKSDP